MFKNILLSSLIFCSLSAFSETAAVATTEKSPWTNESEASVVQISGNTESESYSAKQKTSYTQDANVFSINARFVQSKTSSTETGLAWDASARYERTLSDHWSAFLQHGAESDKFAGYLQRDNTDLGGKYFFIKSEKENLFSELGYRLTRTTSSPIHTQTNESKARLYVEWSRQLNETVSFKLWAEYLPSFENNNKGYLVNYEPSLSAMLNKTFSLKVSQLTKFQNEPGLGRKKEDRTFTTSIVAHF